MAMEGIKRPAGVFTPKVKTVMTHLKIRASMRCHKAVFTPGPADPVLENEKIFNGRTGMI